MLELTRKLLLTGFVFLIPQRHTLLRLVCAQLVTVGHLGLLVIFTPYRQRGTTFFAFGTALTLSCTLNVALLLKVYGELPEAQIISFFVFASRWLP